MSIRNFGESTNNIHQCSIGGPSQIGLACVSKLSFFVCVLSFFLSLFLGLVDQTEYSIRRPLKQQGERKSVPPPFSFSLYDDDDDDDDDATT